MHGDRLAPYAWGPSCPICKGTVLPHMHGDRLAPYAWGPSCPTCMGTVLPHKHGDRLAPYAWGPSCPTSMGTVLPHMHGDRLAPYMCVLTRCIQNTTYHCPFCFGPGYPTPIYSIQLFASCYHHPTDMLVVFWKIRHF